MKTVLPPAPSWYSPQILRSSPNGLVAYGSKNVLVVLTPRPDLPPNFVNNDAGTVLEAVNDSPPPLSTEGSNESNKKGGSDGDWRDRSESPTQSELISDLVPHPFATMLPVCGDKAKITCLVWSPDSSQVAVGFDDGLVKMISVEGWGEETELASVQVHSTHREVSKERCKVNTIAWSHLSPDNVISGDDLGTIVIWDVKVNATRFLTFGRQSIHVLETHPFIENVVGYGCRLGLVFVVDISGSGKMLQKIRAHDEDIQSLSWSPSKFWDILQDDENGEGGEVREDSLLAVTSRDKSITIWSSRTGKRLASLWLPGRPDKKYNKFKQDAQKGTWTTCHWLKRDVILSSGFHGELLQWQLDRLRRKSPGSAFYSDGNEARVVHREHARTLYSICSHGDGTVFTSGQDRNIVAVNVARNVLLFTLPTFAAAIFSIMPNPFDPSVVALGAGDGQIRVWKMSSTKSTFDVTTMWNKLSATKITALAWHPDKESTLAFGTDEGRVGIFESFSPRSFPVFCEFKHRSTVYTVCWGPPIISSEGTSKQTSSDLSSCKKALYSCGDNAVFMHNDGLKKSTNIDSINGKDKDRRPLKRSDVAFEPSRYRYVLLGSDDGSVEIFSMLSTFHTICILKSFNKLIQSIAWHPHYIGSSSTPSKLHNWIAVASNEHEVHVWDLTEALEERVDDVVIEVSPSGEVIDEQTSYDIISGNELSVESDDPDSTVNGDVTDKALIPDGDVVKVDTESSTRVLSKPTFVLKAHHQRVIFLTWSPHEDGKLVSVSYDNTAQVWNAEEGLPVANFSGHGSRLFSALWSPIDKDVVFTGGDDSTVFGWRISEQKNILPVKKMNKKLLNANAREATIPLSTFDDLLEDRKREIQKRLLMEEQQEKKLEEQETGSTDCKEATTQQDFKVLQAKRRQMKKALFSASFQHQKNAWQETHRECQLLQELYSKDEEKQKNELSQLPHLGFFTDKQALDKILQEEVDSLRSQGMDEPAGYLRSFTGDYGEAVRNAIQNSKLSDWFVSLAHATSHDLWLEACQAYANQLIKDDDILKGSSYLLMSGQVLEAIDVLKKNDYHQAAISIAKSRLPDDSIILRDLYVSWAYLSIKNGQFGMAAKCWIAAGDLIQASASLSKQKDPDSLRVASLLSAKGGDRETSRILAIHCASKSVEKKDWKCLDRLANECNFAEVKEIQEQSQAQRFVVEAVNNGVDADVDQCDKADGDDATQSGRESIENSTDAGLENEKVENLAE